MIGEDIAAALPEMRAQAESLMVDACRITKPGSGRGTWNEPAGQYDPPAPVEVYAGKCRIQLNDVAATNPVAGEREWTVQDAIVNLPVVGSEAVEVDQTVTITAATLDTALLGRVYRVDGEHQKTYATARRLRCKEISGGELG